jgi:hypothetical protein
MPISPGSTVPGKCMAPDDPGAEPTVPDDCMGAKTGPNHRAGASVWGPTARRPTGPTPGTAPENPGGAQKVVALEKANRSMARAGARAAP